jgi:hypothetical protein
MMMPARYGDMRAIEHSYQAHFTPIGRPAEPIPNTPLAVGHGVAVAAAPQHGNEPSSIANQTLQEFRQSEMMDAGGMW